MRQRIPPHALFVASAVFHYLGPAFAVMLFARVEPLGVAWLRIVSAAVVLAAWRRPWRTLARLDRAVRALVLRWGAVLAAMNCCFYLAIDRLPLGTVAAIEFLPVIVLAAAGARTPRNALALVLAVPGVYLLTGVRLSVEPLGVTLAFANAALFAAYIVVAHRAATYSAVGRGAVDGLDGLAGAMLVAAIAVTPVAGWVVAPAAADPVALAAGAAVGVCSSVLPYVLDQLAMRRLARATYALMVSLLPATATVVGIVVLAQLPSAAELAGVALVIAGVGIHREPAPARAAPTAPTHDDPAPPAGDAGAPGRPELPRGTSAPTEEADRARRASGGTAAAIPSTAPSAVALHGSEPPAGEDALSAA
jgi:inner membrane transporter RhtA